MGNSPLFFTQNALRELLNFMGIKDNILETVRGDSSQLQPLSLKNLPPFKLRSLNELFDTKFDVPSAKKVEQRLDANGKYYFWNYAAFIIGLFIIQCAISPSLFFSLLICGALGFCIIETPNHSIKINDTEIKSSQLRIGLVALLALYVISSGIISQLLWGSLFPMALVASHAATKSRNW